MSKKKKLYAADARDGRIHITNKTIARFKDIVAISKRTDSRSNVLLLNSHEKKLFKKHKEIFKFFSYLGRPFDLATTNNSIEFYDESFKDRARARNAQLDAICKGMKMINENKSGEGKSTLATQIAMKVLPESEPLGFPYSSHAFNLDGDAITANDIANFNVGKECFEANLEHLKVIINKLYESKEGLLIGFYWHLPELGIDIDTQIQLFMFKNIETPEGVLRYVMNALETALQDNDVPYNSESVYNVAKCVLGYLTALIRPQWGVNSFKGRKYIAATDFLTGLPIWWNQFLAHNDAFYDSTIKFNNLYSIAPNGDSECLMIESNEKNMTNIIKDGVFMIINESGIEPNPRFDFQEIKEAQDNETLPEGEVRQESADAQDLSTTTETNDE